jgi:hypothetical protein
VLPTCHPTAACVLGLDDPAEAQDSVPAANIKMAKSERMASLIRSNSWDPTNLNTKTILSHNLPRNQVSLSAANRDPTAISSSALTM